MQDLQTKDAVRMNTDETKKDRLFRYISLMMIIIFIVCLLVFPPWKKEPVQLPDFNQFEFDESAFLGDYREWVSELYRQLRDSCSAEETDKIVRNAQVKLFPCLGMALSEETVEVFLTPDKEQMILRYETTDENWKTVAWVMWTERDN